MLAWLRRLLAREPRQPPPAAKPEPAPVRLDAARQRLKEAIPPPPE